MTEQTGGQGVVLTMPQPEPLRVLFLDIETAPMITYSWQAKTDYISHEKVIQDPFVLCWAAKWSDQAGVKSAKLTPDECASQADARIVDELADLIREADLVCAHNGDRFDVPRVNARLMLHSLEPLGPVTSIDTLALARKSLGLSHYNLDSLARQLGLGSKIKTDFDLWKDAMHGDELAMQRMVRYCRNDVVLLEKVFYRMRPYVRGLARMVDRAGEGCPHCGSPEIMKRGPYRTQASTFQRYQCQSCLRYFRSRTAIKELKSEYHPL